MNQAATKSTKSNNSNSNASNASNNANTPVTNPTRKYKLKEAKRNGLITNQAVAMLAKAKGRVNQAVASLAKDEGQANQAVALLAKAKERANQTEALLAKAEEAQRKLPVVLSSKKPKKPQRKLPVVPTVMDTIPSLSQKKLSARIDLLRVRNDQLHRDLQAEKDKFTRFFPNANKKRRVCYD